MIDALVSLELYRDHQALLNLIDALTIRKLLNATDAAAITDLQKNLLNSALHFHNECQHTKVVPKLASALSNLHQATRLLDYNEPTHTMARPVARTPLASQSIFSENGKPKRKISDSTIDNDSRNEDNEAKPPKFSKFR